MERTSPLLIGQPEFQFSSPSRTLTPAKLEGSVKTLGMKKTLRPRALSGRKTALFHPASQLPAPNEQSEPAKVDARISPWYQAWFGWAP